MIDSYYTYILLSPLETFEGYPGKPFYVGKGKDDRAYEHLKPTHNHNPLKMNKIRSIRKLGVEPIVHFYKIEISEIEAFQLEVELIALWGRKAYDPKGILTNVLPGGCGVPYDWTGKKHTLATIEKMKNRIITVETRARISAQNKGKRKTEEHKQKLSEARTGYHDSEETKEKKRKTHTGMKHSEAHKKACGDGQRGRKLSEKQILEMSESRSCLYTLTDPEGNQYETSNLRTWAPEHSISYQCLLKVANGIKTDWLGWSCIRLTRPCPTRGKSANK